MRFPGAVRSFPHPCGGRIVPKNREEARKRFAYQPNGVPCGVFLHTFLHRLWKSFALLCGKWERERGLAPGWLAPPCRCCPRRGAWRFWSPVDSAAVVPEGVVCLLCRLPTLPLACFPAPYPPVPLPRRGRGRLKVYFAGGSAPGTPALNHLRHLRNLSRKCQAGAWRFWLPVDFAAVVPEGVACFLCRLPTLPSVYFFAPYPPSPLPRRGRGRLRLFHARGFAPCIPGAEPGRHRSRGVSRAGGEACPHVFLSMP